MLLAEQEKDVIFLETVIDFSACLFWAVLNFYAYNMLHLFCLLVFFFLSYFSKILIVLLLSNESCIIRSLLYIFYMFFPSGSYVLYCNEMIYMLSISFYSPNCFAYCISRSFCKGKISLSHVVKWKDYYTLNFVLKKNLKQDFQILKEPEVNSIPFCFGIAGGIKRIRKRKSIPVSDPPILQPKKVEILKSMFMREEQTQLHYKLIFLYYSFFFLIINIFILLAMHSEREQYRNYGLWSGVQYKSVEIISLIYYTYPT